MIHTEELTKRYADFTAVDNLNLEIPRGEIFGFLGPNGAGKTTTIKMLAGMLQPSNGRIVIDGIDFGRDPLRVKSITGVIPDRPFLYEKLTGEEFLGFLAGIRRIEPSESRSRISELLTFFELTGWKDDLIETYSHGMKQRLAIGGALLHRPRVLIVDEPMVGLDPAAARQIKNLFRALAREGTTLFVSTHSLDVAQDICARVGIIHQGRLIAAGSLDDLRKYSGSDHGTLEDVFLTLVREETHPSAPA
ncbi:MAG: ABC transporter ATP-binding protein [Nitrospirae bacterium]|nr:ABC transporter ATP-binding protein [Nitrospirota bacterium]